MDELPRRYAGVDVPHWEQYTGCWAIEPNRFRDFKDFCARMNPTEHLQASASRPAAANEPDDPGYEILPGGVALMSVIGPMTKYGSSFAPLGGTLMARRTLRAVRQDPKVRGLVMVFDSPGGTVSGTDDLAQEVAATQQQMPVVIHGQDIMASAAYYVGSQGSMIVATKSTLIGSIGVLYRLEDSSAQYAMQGTKVHAVVSAKHKGIGVEGTPITEEQLAEVQRLADAFHGMFVSAIAAGRRMDPGAAELLADGRVHYAAEAKRLGLIDQVGSLDRAVGIARDMIRQREEAGSNTAAPARPGQAPRRSGQSIGPIGPMGQETNAAAECSTALMETETEEMTMNTEITATAAPPAVGATVGGGRLENSAATLAELKAGFADAPAEFHLECLEQERSLSQATSAWMGRLRDKVKAQEAVLKEAAENKPLLKAPGNAAVPSGGVTASISEEELIEEAVKEHKGNRGAAIGALQRNLKKDLIAAGQTNKAANAACAARYPVIFGM